MTDFDVLKERALKDPRIKAEYDRLGPIYKFVGASKDDLRCYDSADHLKTEEELAAFIEVVRVLGGDDRAFFVWALDVVGRAYRRLDGPNSLNGLIDDIKARLESVPINAKVPADFRDRFMIALAEETARNRAVRSIGDFLMVIFEEWEARRPGAA